MMIQTGKSLREMIDRPGLGFDHLSIGRDRRDEIGAILAGVGELAFEWDTTTDGLEFFGEPTHVLEFGPGAVPASGHALQSMIIAAGPSRLEAITRFTGQGREHLALLFGSVANEAEGPCDQGRFYALSYIVQPAPDRSLFVEEKGRAFYDHKDRLVLCRGAMHVVDRVEATLRTWAGDLSGGVLSREILTLRLETALKRAQERSPASQTISRTFAVPPIAGTALIIAGVSDLGRLNQTYGFDVADEVIAIIAMRLRSVLRIDDEIGRYSGNKFGIILKNCTQDDLESAAARLAAAIAESAIKTRHGAISVTIKLGGVMAPRDALTPGDMFQGAEDALNAARAGHASFVCYRADFRQLGRRQSNQRASDEIIAALNDRRIALAFQPIASSLTGGTVYYEGLVRMHGIDGCIKSASHIVPPAERVGLLKHIDMRVIELAIAELIRHPQASISINVDGPSIADGEWLRKLSDMLLVNRIEAGRLIVEITETALIDDYVPVADAIKRLHMIGVKVALDDFGAGHTSFRTLRNLPIDIVKIDGVFMQSLKTSPDDRFFIKTLVKLARHLQMKTVAEWVRDRDTATILKKIGVDYFQGDFVGPSVMAIPGEGAPSQTLAAIVPHCLAMRTAATSAGLTAPGS